MSDDEVEREMRTCDVIRAEMSEEMQEFGIDKINLALDEHKIEKDIATFIKKQYDEKFSGTWHCVVGKCYGCSITHETKYLFFFICAGHYVLIFQSAE